MPATRIAIVNQGWKDRSGERRKTEKFSPGHRNNSITFIYLQLHNEKPNGELQQKTQEKTITNMYYSDLNIGRSPVDQCIVE